MKRTTHWIVVAVCLLFFAACKKDDHGHSDSKSGHVYTLSNQVKNNSVIDYIRSANGTLMYAGSYTTGGTGTGAGLGSQGAVVIAANDILLAVNAGSHSISSLKITGNGPVLKSVVPSGGQMPVSIARYGHLVYALNAGGDGNISGFVLDYDGMLHALPNSTRPLSAANVAPAQIEFVNDGKVLVVTEKASNKIITYTVDNYGKPGAMHSIMAANTTPFGFAADSRGNIFVSEAAGGASGASTVSSYHVSKNGMISLTDGPESAGQTAACWVVIDKKEKYIYATNTGSNNISSFGINSSGNIQVAMGAIPVGTEMGPIDAAFSAGSKYLYVLNGGSHSITAHAASGNGDLSLLQTVPDLPVSAVGLAAR